MRALLSVYDKNGIEEFARALADLGYELVASGGTAATLDAAGIAHLRVEDVTGFAEMLDGRVKTLHPNLHAGILADRSKAAHMEDLQSLDIDPIDVVVCNLYPFAATPSIETIDVGGPSMIRGAAKNHQSVTVIVDNSDFARVLEALASPGGVPLELKRELASRAFDHLSRYDRLIADWLSSKDQGEVVPETLDLSLRRDKVLRYGENPHQMGGLYFQVGESSWLQSMRLLSGLELSYLNLFDADAAWRLVHELSPDRPAAVIIKHANPCGASISDRSIAQAYKLAFESDPISAFGGIVALNRVVDSELAAELAANPKADVVIAPGFAEGVAEGLAGARKSTRLISAEAPEAFFRSIRSIGEAYLVQESDTFRVRESEWKVVTRTGIDDQQLRDLRVAWTVCARTSSNAIVIARDEMAVGIGAGQQNRLDSSRIAISKAGTRVTGAVAASDAFFPFPDGMLALADAGVAAVISPGGSIRDAEVIEAANHAGIAMVFTGERHFRH